MRTAPILAGLLGLALVALQTAAADRALTPSEVFMARYGEDGAIERLSSVKG